MLFVIVVAVPPTGTRRRCTTSYLPRAALRGKWEAGGCMLYTISLLACDGVFYTTGSSTFQVE